MSGNRIPLAGVVGWPVAHSKSPVLHGYWLQVYNIKGKYIPLGIEDHDFEHCIRTLPKLGFKGVNVTIPYKEKMLALADIVSDRAKAIGAANTVVFQDDGLIYADNTDGVGFLNNLRQNELTWSASNGPALVLGAGGAARAIIAALLEDGVPEVILTNRTRARAEDLSNVFGQKVRVVDWDDRSKMVSSVATIVNTSSLGMTGNPELSIDLSKANSETLVTDIVYAPLETNLLKQAKACGLHTVDGLGMLLHQAVPGFEAWFGQKPVVDDVLRDVVLNA